ncbi:MAG TPA: methyltransferase domain-containing protein [Acidimicrobiales bacterium]|nr:methyltransferase domain-containing protein [Acidimicrobiales bacterium]
MSDIAVDPASHYDRVTLAWRWLLGEELHYGVFDTGDEDLPAATRRLTDLLLAAVCVEPGQSILDVGCGTGAPAVLLASHGATVTGITTSATGMEAAVARAAAAGVSDLVTFELRDGMDNGLPDQSFDRVWVLESSHLMPDRERLIAECARVLRPGGRMGLCDITRQRALPFAEVRRLRHSFGLLRDVFGEARMEPLDSYVQLFEQAGLIVDVKSDLTAATRPTFDRWRQNAQTHEREVIPLLGSEGLQEFVQASRILEGFWDDGTLGYGLVAGRQP